MRTGYVQCIHDVVTPFCLVFLQDLYSNKRQFSKSPANILNQTDAYRCLTSTLLGIPDNQMFAQPRAQLEKLTHRISKPLHNARRSTPLRWMSNIVMKVALKSNYVYFGKPSSPKQLDSHTSICTSAGSLEVSADDEGGLPHAPIVPSKLTHCSVDGSIN